MNKQEAKADAGKLEIDLVPVQMVRDAAEVRMYGNRKYGDPNNWKRVELRRYINAMLRHTLSFWQNPKSAAYKAYTVKRKMMLYFHGITIKEV